MLAASRLLTFSVVLIAAFSGRAAERPNPYLSQARVYYLGLEYEKCVERLGQAAQWKSTLAEQVEIELYAGLCRFDLRQENAAADHFRMALLLDRHARLPPDTSPPIRRLFDQVAAHLPAQPEERALAPVLPPPARVELAPSHLPAPAPKGLDLPPAPPLRRSWALPASLAGAAVAVGIVAVVFGIQARGFETRANAAPKEIDAFNLGNAARRDAVVSNVGSGVAGALGLGALLSYFLQPSPGQQSEQPRP